MSSILSIIFFVIILSVIIIVHEFGHLLAAKYFGVYCKEFSIGMGPLLWQRKKGETAWSLRAFPIGGFVAMAGEEGEDEDDDLNIPYERTINGIHPWKQVIVMAAGALMNIVLAWVIFIGITAYQGAVVVPSEPIVQSLVDGMAAQEAGIIPGDKIIKVVNGDNEIAPESAVEVSEFIQYYTGKTTFTVLRDEEEIEISFTPTYNKEGSLYQMGIYFIPSTIKEISFLEAIPYGTKEMINSVASVIGALGNLIRGVGLSNLSGPVGIYQVTAEVTQDGLISTLALIGLLSVNVGIMNLVPIPILDGGRILILLVESIIGRKLSERLQMVIMYAGLILIVGLMVFATFNDILRLL